MNFSKLPLGFGLGSFCVLVGYIALKCMLPWLQHELIPLFPSWMDPVTIAVAIVGLYGFLGLMLLGALPKFHPLRVGGYCVGALAFMLNLLIKPNDGNVLLEAALVTLMFLCLLYALFFNATSIRMSRDKKVWAQALNRLAVYAVIGIIVATMWTLYMPRYHGRHWGDIAQGGAIILLFTLAFFEVGAIREGHWSFPLFYGLGNILLLVSYFGQPTFIGEALNVAMCLLMMYVPLITKRLQSQSGERELCVAN